MYNSIQSLAFVFIVIRCSFQSTSSRFVKIVGTGNKYDFEQKKLFFVKVIHMLSSAIWNR